MNAFLRNAALTIATAATVAVTATPAFADLHVGDHVTVTVYEHPELSGDVTISSEGDISVALIGRIRAVGVDQGVLAERIRTRLASYVIDPAVSIKLETQGDAAFLSGAAAGTVLLHPGETLLSAIADGKVQPDADLRRVALVRNARVIGNYDVRLMRTTGYEGPLIQSGDVIRVPTRSVDVDVVGAVKLPGNLYLDPAEPLGDAIQQAGPGEDANLEHIVLIRDGVSLPVTLGGEALLEPPHPGDRLVVPQSELVEVVGYVEHPGVVALKTDNSLLSALFLAGGPGQTGDLRNVRVIHRDGIKTNYDLRGYQKGDLSQNPTLHDGDIVYVSQQHGFDFRILFDVLLFGSRFIRIR